MHYPFGQPERVLLCPGCSRELARYINTCLKVGEVLIDKVVTLRCVSCGRKRRWAPGVLCPQGLLPTGLKLRSNS